jgi:hypothetical protein
MANLKSISTAKDGRGNALVIETDGHKVVITEAQVSGDLNTPSKIKDAIENRLSKLLDMEFRIHFNRDGTLQVIYGEVPVTESIVWSEDLPEEEQ